MIIRKLVPEEFDLHFKVSSMAFIWSYESGKETNPQETLYGAFNDDNKTLLADLEIIDLDSNFCGHVFPAIGIGGVASFPQHRRRGAIRGIFNEIEKLAKAEGWVLGYLFPFSTEYYRKFGYERIVKSVSLTTKFSNFSSIARDTSVTLYEGNNLEELLSVYNAYAKNYNLMTMRKNSEYFSKEPYKDCKYTYMWRDSNNIAKAYVTYQVDRTESIVNVEELVYSDKESLLGMLGFLRTYDGNINSVSFTKLPLNSPLFEIFPEYNDCKNQLKYGAAVRIYDIEKILKLNTYPKEHGSFSILSIDSIPENSGVFKVEYQDGKAEVTKVKSDEYDISVTPAAASKLLLSGEGYTKEALEYVDGVKVNGNIDDFLRAFPRRIINMWERF